MSAGEKGWKMLLLVALSLIMFCHVRTADVQEQDVKKRGTSPNRVPTTISDMYKLLVELEQR